MKIMILGAGIYQVPLIKKAKDIGFYVITVDYLPNNIGHRYSDLYVNCSTTFKEGVLKAAKKYNIDGIITFASDIAVDTVSYVSEKMSLIGVNRKISRIMTKKNLFRLFQSENKLNTPDYYFLKSLDFDLNSLKKNKKYIIKPIDSSGSKGINIITSDLQMDEIRKYIKTALDYSLEKKVIIEELLEGIDVTGEGFVNNGEIEICFFTRKEKKGFIPVKHIIPSGLNNEQISQLYNEANDLFCKIGYKDGPFDFDAIITENKVCIIEISPRLGGNGVPLAISWATNNDYLELLLKYCVGNFNNINYYKKIEKNIVSYIFGSDESGVISDLPEIKRLIKDNKYIKELYYRYSDNDNINKFIDSSHSIGYSILDVGKNENVDGTIKKFNKLLNYRVTKINE